MKSVRSLGWIWLVLSPILFLMAAISTVKSDLTYTIQLACFGAVAVAGMIGGIALLLGQSAGQRTLRLLSWLGFAYFTTSALLALVFHVVNAEVTFQSLALVTAIAAMIGATGIPFLLMARRLSGEQPARAEHVTG